MRAITGYALLVEIKNGSGHETSTARRTNPQNVLVLRAGLEESSKDIHPSALACSSHLRVHLVLRTGDPFALAGKDRAEPQRLVAVNKRKSSLTQPFRKLAEKHLILF